jgi:hypothetical protein
MRLVLRLPLNSSRASGKFYPKVVERSNLCHFLESVLGLVAEVEVGMKHVVRGGRNSLLNEVDLKNSSC